MHSSTVVTLYNEYMEIYVYRNDQQQSVMHAYIIKKNDMLKLYCANGCLVIFERNNESSCSEIETDILYCKQPLAVFQATL